MTISFAVSVRFWAIIVGGSTVIVTVVPGKRERRENAGGGVTVQVPKLLVESSKRRSVTITVPSDSSTSDTLPVTLTRLGALALVRMSTDEPLVFLRLLMIVVKRIATTMRARLTPIYMRLLDFFGFMVPDTIVHHCSPSVNRVILKKLLCSLTSFFLSS